MIRYSFVPAGSKITIANGETITVTSINLPGLDSFVQFFERDGTTLIMSVSNIAGFFTANPGNFEFTISFIAHKGLVVDNTPNGFAVNKDVTIFYSQSGA